MWGHCRWAGFLLGALGCEHRCVGILCVQSRASWEGPRLLRFLGRECLWGAVLQAGGRKGLPVVIVFLRGCRSAGSPARASVGRVSSTGTVIWTVRGWTSAGGRLRFRHWVRCVPGGRTALGSRICDAEGRWAPGKRLCALDSMWPMGRVRVWVVVSMARDCGCRPAARGGVRCGPGRCSFAMPPPFPVA